MPKLPESTTLGSNFCAEFLSPPWSQAGNEKTVAQRIDLLMKALTRRPPAEWRRRGCSRVQQPLAQWFYQETVSDVLSSDSRLVASKIVAPTPDLKLPAAGFC